MTSASKQCDARELNYGILFKAGQGGKKEWRGLMTTVYLSGILPFSPPFLILNVLPKKMFH